MPFRSATPDGPAKGKKAKENTCVLDSVLEAWYIKNSRWTDSNNAALEGMETATCRTRSKGRHGASGRGNGGGKASAVIAKPHNDQDK